MTSGKSRAAYSGLTNGSELEPIHAGQPSSFEIEDLNVHDIDLGGHEPLGTSQWLYMLYNCTHDIFVLQQSGIMLRFTRCVLLLGLECWEFHMHLAI